MNLQDPKLLRHAAFINGEWLQRPDMSVTNPATGSVIGKVPDCTGAETEAAIAAAETAMVAWRARPNAERADLLMAWHDLMLTHKQDLGRILSAEQGKPLAEAEGEIDYGASFVRWFAEEARRINGKVIPVPGKKIACLERARWGCGDHHALEFPQCDDHPQGRARLGGRLYRCDQTL